MYTPLQLDLMADHERELARRAERARQLRPEAPEAGARRRPWWPRPRRSALRLAMAGRVPFARTSRKACAGN